MTVSDGQFSASDSLSITVTQPATFNFLPVGDAFVRSSSPTSNYGTNTALRLRAGSPAYLSYLKFDVRGTDNTIQRALLRLYVTDASASGGEILSTSNAYGNSATLWIEKGLTYQNAPPPSGNVLNSKGRVLVNTWVEFDVTAAIVGDGLYSFVLRTASTDSVYYSAKEGPNQPVLVIYTQPTVASAGDSVQAAALLVDEFNVTPNDEELDAAASITSQSEAEKSAEDATDTALHYLYLPNLSK